MKLRIKKWKQFQHYGKMRRPPWIKLHRQLLENRKWHQLSAGSAKLLVECWLIASEELDGVLSGDVVTDLAWRLHRTANDLVPALQELTDAGFIDVDYGDEDGAASEVLAGRSSRVEEKRVEKSKRAERREYSEAFEEVWKIHARGPKLKADDAYKAAVGNGVTHSTIVEKLTGYVAAELRLDDSPPFKGQHLFRWLKDERWEEDFVVKDTGYRPEVIYNWFPPGLTRDDK
jgi:hypothetical protein